MKRGDWILLFAVLAICIPLFFANGNLRPPGASVQIVTEQGVFGTYALSGDREIEIREDGHVNTVIISGGQVWMKEADCPQGRCLAQHPVSKAGQTIVCLPNRVLLRVEGAGQVKQDLLDDIAH